MNNDIIILIIGDDLVFNNNIVDVLKSYNYPIYIAKTGAEALHMLESDLPDIIFMDINLPDVDGYSVLKDIRKTRTMSDCYIVMTSSDSNERAHHLKGLESGADDFISLPLSSRELVARIESPIKLKRIEKSLRKSEERYNSLIDKAPVIIYSLNPEGFIITSLNPAFEAVSGYSRESWIGRSIIDIIHPDEKEKVISGLEQLKSELRTISTETRVISNEGYTLTIDSVTAPEIFNGKLAEIFGFGWDITERIKTENALTTAKEKALEASSAKSEFLSSMSHELRTPLNAIIGFTELLQDEIFGSLNPKQSEYLDIVSKSAKHLQSLIDDILEFTTMESTNLPINLMSINLKEVLLSSVQMIIQKAENKNIGVNLFMKNIDKRTKITTDGSKLKHIMMNLLSNAVKFTPIGGAMEVDAELTESKLIISITDTGIGIDPAVCLEIFSPFYQVSAKKSGKTPGTGLGLSICRKLIHNLGGEIRCISKGYGMGSTFIFSLPIHDETSLM